MIRLVAILTICSLYVGSAYSADELLLPRFVSLKSNEVNMRVGPGTRYPIEWVYRRKGLPVEIIEEYLNWRKIRDMNGASGWVHRSLLMGARHITIKGDSSQVTRTNSDDNSPATMELESGVQGKLLECRPLWCKIKIMKRKGWIKKQHLWGVYSSEIF